MRTRCGLALLTTQAFSVLMHNVYKLKKGRNPSWTGVHTGASQSSLVPIPRGHLFSARPTGCPRHPGALAAQVPAQSITSMPPVTLAVAASNPTRPGPPPGVPSQPMTACHHRATLSLPPTATLPPSLSLSQTHPRPTSAPTTGCLSLACTLPPAAHPPYTSQSMEAASCLPSPWAAHRPETEAIPHKAWQHTPAPSQPASLLSGLHYAGQPLVLTPPSRTPPPTPVPCPAAP